MRGGAGGEDSRHAELLERRQVLVGDDAAAEQEHVVGAARVEERRHLAEVMHVGARQDRQADGVDILLYGSVHDHLRGLAQPGIDDLHTRVAQGTSDDLRTAIVPVETGLRDQNPNGTIAHIATASS